VVVEIVVVVVVVVVAIAVVVMNDDCGEVMHAACVVLVCRYAYLCRGCCCGA
jgi:hypothetical protein